MRKNLCVQEYINVRACACACVTLRIIGYLRECVCACVAARLREINKCYDRKMKALLWVTTEHRGRVGTHARTHTHTHTHTHIYILPSCLLVMWVW